MAAEYSVTPPPGEGTANRSTWAWKRRGVYLQREQALRRFSSLLVTLHPIKMLVLHVSHHLTPPG